MLSVSACLVLCMVCCSSGTVVGWSAVVSGIITTGRKGRAERGSGALVTGIVSRTDTGDVEATGP